MNLIENIQRINTLISEDRKSDTIKNMMDKMELLALYKFDEWDNNDIPYKREKHNYDVYQKRKLNVNIRPNMINNIRKMLYDNRHMIKK